MDARKALARKLDDAALTADSIEMEPATGKQCWYLAGLIAAKGTTVDEIEALLDLPNPLSMGPALTKRTASRLIDEFKAAA